MKNKNKKLQQKPNEDLRELLRIINFVPAGTKIKFSESREIINLIFKKVSGADLPNISYDKQFENHTSEVFKSLVNMAYTNALEEIDNITAKFPELNKYVFAQDQYHVLKSDINVQRRVFKKYDFFVMTYKTLKKFAKTCNDFCDDKHSERRGIIPIHLIMPIQLHFTIRENIFSFDDVFFLKAIRQFDARRLRLCIVCERVFWAYRLNNKYCSSKCANYQHSKETRQNPQKKELINAQRSHNRFVKLFIKTSTRLEKAKTNEEKIKIRSKLEKLELKRSAADEKVEQLKKGSKN